MQQDHESNMPALRREWLAARILAVIAVLLLITVVGVIVADTFLADTAPLPVASAPPVPTEITPPPAADVQAARTAEDIALCDAALAAVQGQGLLPTFATRDGDTAEPTQVRGRYVCHAKTTAAKYTIAFDLACTRLGEAGCIVPFQIAQDRFGVLYQRP